MDTGSFLASHLSIYAEFEVTTVCSARSQPGQSLQVEIKPLPCQARAADNSSLGEWVCLTPGPMDHNKTQRLEDVQGTGGCSLLIIAFQSPGVDT